NRPAAASPALAAVAAAADTDDRRLGRADRTPDSRTRSRRKGAPAPAWRSVPSRAPDRDRRRRKLALFSSSLLLSKRCHPKRFLARRNAGRGVDSSSVNFRPAPLRGL